MLEIVTYLSWQVSHNYKHLVVLFFVSIFCLFYWYYCKAKPVLHHIIPILFFMTFRIHYAGALSATSADVIHGHAPYLTFDGGATKSDIKALFGIRLPDGREYVPDGGYKSDDKWIDGLFNEWGEFTYNNRHRNDDWRDDLYWASDGYIVSLYGDITTSNNNIYTYAMAACVTP